MASPNIEMATVSTAHLLDEAGNFKVFPAGVVLHRPKAPPTGPIPLHKVRAPKSVKVESGVHAPPTKPTYGHVRISKYPGHFAGMDAAGFMC
jgi:hypothetical protein